jgi:hypothetical protein
MTERAKAEMIAKQNGCNGVTCASDGVECPCRPACSKGKLGPTTGDNIIMGDTAREWLASHPEASKPVERFEVGKWYKFVPRPSHVSEWTAEWADGMPKMADKISQEGEAVHFVGVRFGGGQAIRMAHTDYFEVPAPTEPAKDSPQRLTVGDRVVITGGGTSQSDWTGKHGIIAEDDHSVVRPYRIKIDGGEENGIEWRIESEVIPEPPGYTAEAPKTTDPSAEKILAEYYGPLRVQVIKYASGDVKVITPRVGKLSRVQERQRAREARLLRI